MATLLAPGLTAKVELTVTDADTAQALGSGDVPVLGTPRVLALAEAATVAATARVLDPGKTTVGVKAEVEHMAPSPVGRQVVAEAKLTDVNGKRLRFEVLLRDGGKVAAQGVVHRVIVDRHDFLTQATTA